MAGGELNLDGLIGPTHHYAGLSPGNLASQHHRGRLSHPKQAALQGLAKMKLLADLGVEQGVLPPQPRPNIAWLRQLGFTGTDEQVLYKAGRDAGHLLAAASSASSMWAANAATVSPSADAADGKVHFTPANLISEAHRSLEPADTAAVLRRIFADPERFAHHPPLPANDALRDEGAANHIRLAADHDRPGVALFVYGMDGADRGAPPPHRYRPRQTADASEAVARQHQLAPDRVVFAQQHPDAVDAGVFHNDVIATGHLNVLLCHRLAFPDTDRVIDALRQTFRRCCGEDLCAMVVEAEQVSLEEAVASYLFNSQIVTAGDGRMVMICPEECRERPTVAAYLRGLVADKSNPISETRFVDLRQSMHNGGGPACLRVRVPLHDDELALVHPGIRLDDALYGRLVQWVHRHYRDTLSLDDLADPKLLRESREALEEVMGILGLEDLAIW